MEKNLPLILIVDDKSENIIVLENLLEDFDVRLFSAQSGNEALELCLQHDFSLIMMDVSMPEMDGFEASKLIQTRRDVPIIFITAFAKDWSSELKGYESGAIDYITKPIDPVIIKSKVKILLELNYKSKELLRISEKLSSINSSLLNEIVERKLAQEKVRKFSLAIEQSPVSILITDIEGNIEYINSKFCHVTGYSHNEVMGKNPRFLKSGKMPQEGYKHLWQKISKGDTWTGELLNKKKDGGLIWERTKITPIKDGKDQITHYLGVYEDITEEKAQEEKLLRMAYFDELTGLPSRSMHLARLAHEISRTKRTENKVALFFIDLDGFKNINDIYGHSLGDQLLISVAERMKEATRISDNITRIGGDEFCVIISDVQVPMEVETAAKRIIKAFAEPFQIEHKKISITCSIGIALYPDDAEDPEDLYSKADTAMYKVKNSGRNHYQYFTQEMNIALKKRYQYESALSTALKNNELRMVYQPIVELALQKVIGFEALLRWEHPSFGNVPPEQFIKIAEEMGLINPIGEWVIETSCKAIANIREQTGYPYSLSVNVSAHQFHTGTLCAAIESALKRNKLDSKTLQLELTENIIIQSRSGVLKELEKIQSLGVKLCIDDFGTGYSSLAYLIKYYFDFVKIDKMFIMDYKKGEKHESLLNAIIGMANGMKIQLIAEGIETKEQQNYLIERNCTFGQGFYLSRPMEYENVLKFKGVDNN
ncbi:MAG: EAL domain-containing protein [Leptospirales bacterium]